MRVKISSESCLVGADASYSKFYNAAEVLVAELVSYDDDLL